MLYEKSCGFVVYDENQGARKYLVIRARNGDYGFPKGHVEGDETEYETALRELKEETNLELQIFEGFRRQVEYTMPRKRNITKRCVYFLGRCTSDNIVCQASEVLEAEFLPLDEALNLLTFDNTKEILKEADAFIASRL